MKFLPLPSVCFLLFLCLACSAPAEEPEADIAVDAGGEVCLPTSCDDGNPCTDDLCTADGNCKNVIKVGKACDDDNACTLGDACDAQGMCGGTQNLVCEDDNTCTKDTCDPEEGCQFEPLADETACEDGSLCTEGATCQQGVCAGGQVKECEDQDPTDCLAKACDPGTGECAPMFLPEGTSCKDGNACTDEDHCNADGECVAGEQHACDAQHPCKKSYCNPDAQEGTNPCVQEWKDAGVGCDDGDKCTDEDQCKEVGENGAELKCTGTPIKCTDGNPCTSDSCDEESGCQYDPLADGMPCGSDDPCATKGTCQDGECIGSTESTCNDNNPCTDDSCDPETGECFHENNSAGCDDGNLCTTDDVCSNGGCSGTPVDCSGLGNPCIKNECNPDTGVCDMPMETGTPCPDDDLCNGAESCSAGQCVAGNPVACPDDGNPCTLDECNPADGTCGQVVDDGTPCGEDDPCTGGASCQNGECKSGEPVVCEDDGNECTQDICDSQTGQCGVPVDDGTQCNDNNLCTDGDTCQVGACIAGEQLDCDDANPCTDDSCSAELGCQYSPNDLACSDDSVCTDGDQCTGGECIPGSALDCDDGNECTTDSCDADTGCLNDNVEDGTQCGGLSGWTCLAGQCQCQPACDGKDCGPDGCSGTCGECGDGLACDDTGTCSCVPDCTGKECGDDGCSGSCGTCPGNQDACVEGSCVCQPVCDGKECGDDGCGGSCGACQEPYACQDGACVCEDQGDILWQIELLGYQSAEFEDVALDGSDFVAAGWTNSDDPNVTRQLILARFNYADGLEWQVYHESGADLHIKAVSVLADSSIVVVGDKFIGASINYDIVVLKFDSQGQFQWEKTFGDANEDRGTGVTVLNNGSILVVGWTKSYGSGASDYFMARMTPDGDVLWDTAWGTGAHDEAADVCATADGGFVVLGHTDAYGAGSYDYWAIRFDATGKMVWDETYGHTKAEYAMSAIALADGGFAFLGYTDSIGAGAWDYWLVRTDGDGNQLWTQTFGHGGWDQGESVTEMPDGGFALIGMRGTTPFNATWLIRTDIDGNVLWDNIIDGYKSDRGTGVAVTGFGALVMVGHASDEDSGAQTAWLAVTVPDCAACVPNCSGVECGGDGCGGSCGECVPGKLCSNGKCAGLWWTDGSSGLMWQDPPANLSTGQQAALDYCEDLVLDGLDDWRLPNISELRSLIRGCEQNVTGGQCQVDAESCSDWSCQKVGCWGCLECAGPGLAGSYWPPNLSGSCWGWFRSSTPVGDMPDAWWRVVFKQGLLSYAATTGEGRIRCVRTQQ